MVKVMKGEEDSDEMHGDRAVMKELRERGKNVRVNEKQPSEIGGGGGEWRERMNGNHGRKR